MTDDRRSIYQLIELHPRLFIRGHTRHCNTVNMLHALRGKGISLVINVALIPDEHLESACRVIGIDYRHVPLSDSQRRGIPTDTVRSLIDLVAERMKFTGVLVHCDSGWNRSNLVAIPALAKFHKCGTAKLIEEIRNIRPKVLKNKTFEQFVLGCDYNAIEAEKA